MLCTLHVRVKERKKDCDCMVAVCLYEIKDKTEEDLHILTNLHKFRITQSLKTGCHEVVVTIAHILYSAYKCFPTTKIFFI